MLPGSQGLQKLMFAFQTLEPQGFLLLVLISPILFHNWEQHFKHTLQVAAKGKKELAGSYSCPNKSRLHHITSERKGSRTTSQLHKAQQPVFAVLLRARSFTAEYQENLFAGLCLISTYLQAPLGTVALKVLPICVFSVAAHVTVLKQQYLEKNAWI